MNARRVSTVLIATILGLGQLCVSSSRAAEEDNGAAQKTPIQVEAEVVKSHGGAGPPATLLASSWWGAVEQAQRWKLAGDVALVSRQPVTAYPFYDKLAKTFPGTPHGRVAADRGNYALSRLRHAGNYPPEEDILMELYDLLTW